MIRLAGLPAAARFGRAEVEVGPRSVSIAFSGPGGSRTVEAPLAHIAAEDLEATLLRLLADLRRLGYEPSWRREAAGG